MNYLKEMIAKLIAKGFATAAEKNEVNILVKSLTEDEKADVKDDAACVAELPKEDPAVAEEKEAEAQVEKSLNSLMAKMKKELGADITSEMKKAIKEHLELKEKKAGMYNKEISASEKRVNQNGYLRSLIKGLVTQDVVSLKELTTDASGSPYGGYVVDSELSAEIRHLITEYGVARREMTTVTLSKNSYKANSLATDVTVYWVDEGAAIGSTQVVLGQSTLELEKLGAIVTMTSELLEDEELDLMSFIGSRVAEGFAKAEDEAFFKGDGTSTYGGFTGLLKNTATNNVAITGTTFTSVDADDLIDMVDATPQGALSNSKYFLHRTIMSVIRKLKATDGTYIYQAPSVSGPATIWGYPVVLVEAMPAAADTAVSTAFVLFGDMKKACIHGTKAGGLKAASFNAGSVRNVADSADINLITTDREAVRWTERVGFIAIVPTALTRLTTAAS